MKRTKKIMTLAIAALLLVSTTVAVTVAYLTAETKVVTNTFTVGNVRIDLNEADVDLYGVEIPDADRVTENKYKLIPGHTYVKDPTVYVEKGSEECYVFVKVVNGLTDIELIDEDYVSIADQMKENGWSQLEVDGQNISDVFYYNTTVNVLEAKENASLIVFENFAIGGNAVLTDEKDNDKFLFADAKITIDAYAIQADGFGSAADAWKAAPSTWK